MRRAGSRVGATFPRLVVLGATLFLFAANAVAQSVSVFAELGDRDFFGFGYSTGPINSPVPRWDFDNQEPTDPPFTDKDLRKSRFGPDSDNDIGWKHDLSALVAPGAKILAAKVTFAIGGIQDAAPCLTPPADDRLFFEGIEVPGAWDTVDQGPAGTGLMSFCLDARQLASLESSRDLDVFIDGFKAENSGCSANELESYFIDYVVVELQLARPPLLGTDLLTISASTGGTQTLSIAAGSKAAGETYVVLGSASGTSPGVPFLGITIPLVLDQYMTLSLASANSSVFVNTFGVLGPNGTATAQVALPPVAGLTDPVRLHHAVLVSQSFGPPLVSMPVALVVEP